MFPCSGPFLYVPSRHAEDDHMDEALRMSPGYRFRMATLHNLADEIADLLRDGTFTTDRGRKTVAYHAAAERILEARENFLGDDGSPDLAGRTFAYREWMKSVYFRAGLGGDQMRKTQAAVAYHVGNVLREMYDEETLEAYGLRAMGPRERSVEKRERMNAVLRSVTGSSSGFADADTLRTLRAAAVLLDKVTGEGLDATARREARSLLTAVEAAAAYARTRIG